MNDLEWIKAVVHNDENSTDEELEKYFIENNLTKEEAKERVRERNFYLKCVLCRDCGKYKYMGEKLISFPDDVSEICLCEKKFRSKK